MALKPLEGFQSLKTHHCVTGSMRHVYVFNDHPLGEEMLLGLGGGVGFVYWQMRGADPFLGGRAKGRPGQGFERCVGTRTGVAIKEFTTSSSKKAEQALLALLDSGQPVMVQVDIGFLPYFDFGGHEYHFGAHMITVCGYDDKSGRVIVADRERELHVISADDLKRARGSEYKPFPPKHRWYVFDFANKRFPTSDEVRAAIGEQATEMLQPPIRNLGVEGIRKAAQMIPKWLISSDTDTVRRGLFNYYIFIDAKGGSGGGLFRYMFSRFLSAAAGITDRGKLEESSLDFKIIGDRWQELAEIFKQGSQQARLSSLGTAVADILMEISHLEKAAWEKLRNNIG
jgi:hypothetical protein